VFENDLVEMDAAATQAAAEANEHTLITAETRRLQIAAHWADLHPGDALPPPRLPGTQHPIRLGGEGTPTVGDFAAAELGCVLRISDSAAAKLIADALDLRHRLPHVWAVAQTGQVPAHQARRIATATRDLTAQQTTLVDQRLHRPSARSLGPGCRPCSRPPLSKPTRPARHKPPPLPNKNASSGSAAAPNTA
jgi:Domain of unknown function (DUF222)